MKRFVTIIATLLLGLMISSTATAEILDRIVARVNTEVVTLYDVRQATVPYVLQQGMNPAILQDEERRAALYKEVLEDLVDRKLLLQEAAKLELEIKDSELDRWLEFTRQQQGMTQEQFEAMIAQYGMRPDAYREMVRQNLLKIRMIKIKVGSQVSVSEDEVDQLYRERFGNSGDSEKFVTVSHILFRPENDSPAAKAAAKKRAMKVNARLKNGEEFEEVAKEASEGPTAEKGGFLGSFRRGELDPEFEEVAFEMEPGDTSGVVETKFGYHIIRVSEVDRRASPDMAERKDQLRGEIQQRKMEELLDQYIQTLRTRAFVDIRY
jgi:peptidyl-prolyl cis-trans isomerase SurA